MSKTQQINTLQRLTVGQPTTIKASTWNAFVQHVESSNNDDLPPVKSNDNSTVIICKNTTGSAIPAFTMVSLETKGINRAKAQMLTFGEVIFNSIILFDSFDVFI